MKTKTNNTRYAVSAAVYVRPAPATDRRIINAVRKMYSCQPGTRVVQVIHAIEEIHEYGIPVENWPCSHSLTPLFIPSYFFMTQRSATVARCILELNVRP